MRSAFILATVCLLAASQPGLAAQGYIRLSKPDTSYRIYMNDRNACFQTAFMHRTDHYTLWSRYDLNTFTTCMATKGYRSDPKGYRAAWYITNDGSYYALEPQAPWGMHP
jgi:hypothetical protein